MPAQNQSPQNQSLQTEIISQGNLFLSPAEFFCGDKVTVSFTFSLKEYPNVHFENMFLSGSQINKIIQNENPDVSVTEISVSSFPSSLQGTIDLTCVFWKSGEVEIPVLKIPLTNSELNSELALGDGDGKTSASQLNDENEATMLEIHLPSVNVSSILEKTGVTSIRDYKGPEIIPGSTALVWTGIFISLSVLTLLIFALVKSKTIAKFFKNLITKYRFRKFYKKSYKKLSLLSNFLNDSSTVDDVTANVDFCLKLQTIIRDYFAVRFFSGIYNMTTEEITKYLTENIEKFLPGNLTLFFYDVMSKCDAVRFSGNIDEKKNLTAEDKKMLIEKSYSILNGIHTGVPFDADI